MTKIIIALSVIALVVVIAINNQAGDPEFTAQEQNRIDQCIGWTTEAYDKEHPGVNELDDEDLNNMAAKYPLAGEYEYGLHTVVYRAHLRYLNNQPAAPATPEDIPDFIRDNCENEYGY